MGCTSSRTNTPPQEITIQEMETRLGFQNCECDILDMQLRKFVTNGVIPFNKWTSLSNQLRLSLSNSSLSPNTESMLESFKCPDGYILVNVLVLGILLSKGSVKEKMKLLYESHDQEHHKEISYQKYIELISLLITISVDLLPLLVSSDFCILTSESDVKLYVSTLKELSEYAKPRLASRLLGKNPEREEAVKKEDIMYNASDPDLGKILSPSGIRTFIYSIKLREQ